MADAVYLNIILNCYFLAENPVSGLNYYRLKQFDFDEQFSYYPGEFINYLVENLPISCYSNPAINELVLIGTEEMGTVIIIDLNG